MLAATLSGCSRLDDPSLQPPFDAGKAPDLAVKAQPANTYRNLYFGDLHIHTSLSTDAYVFGVRSLPEDVYTFDRGGVIEHGAGYPIKIARPLDFAAVTDHAEYLGQARLAGLDVPTTRRPLGDLLLNGNTLSITWAWLQSTLFIKNKGFGFGVDKPDQKVNRAAWKMTIEAAERNYNPGAFTSFIAYEWSAFAGPDAAHTHRNVIYRSGQVSAMPFSYLDSQQPEDLWRFLQRETDAGRAAFAIPHNGNLSDGYMYRGVNSDGSPLTSAQADLRARFEPVSEILQIKGSSETHPLLSGLDEFADFELASLLPSGEKAGVDVLKNSYARGALRTGLEFAHTEGFNPFRFGVIGASDSHNASSPSEEGNYHGKLPLMDGSAGLRTNQALALPESVNPVVRWGSGGLAGVWAEENTRESLFDALQRKETFATSGPRIRVRFFAGWGFEKNIVTAPDLVERAYAKGVAMGGTLSVAPAGRGPAFLVTAMKDPEGANLDRAQIIKAWVDDQGMSHEKVFDVAASDGRVIDKHTGKLPPVGNTVDVDTATYRNTIGASSLATVWADPGFDPDQQALYYARVIEIPTPRWSTYDAKRLGTEPMAPAAIQERAITSAIWYIPKKHTHQLSSPAHPSQPDRHFHDVSGANPTPDDPSQVDHKPYSQPQVRSGR